MTWTPRVGRAHLSALPHLSSLCFPLSLSSLLSLLRSDGRPESSRASNPLPAAPRRRFPSHHAAGLQAITPQGRKRVPAATGPRHPSSQTRPALATTSQPARPNEVDGTHTARPTCEARLRQPSQRVPTSGAHVARPARETPPGPTRETSPRCPDQTRRSTGRRALIPPPVPAPMAAEEQGRPQLLPVHRRRPHGGKAGARRRRHRQPHWTRRSFIGARRHAPLMSRSDPRTSLGTTAAVCHCRAPRL